MPPKRDQDGMAQPDLEISQQKKQRLADAVPDNVPLALNTPSGPKLLSNPRKKIRFVSTNDEILAMSASRRKKFRHEEWLHRSISWDGLTTPEGGSWKGVKVVGQGTYGICGWFQYTGPNKSIPQSLVVKQGGPNDKASLLRESRMLSELMTTGSKHIVQMFKSIFYSAGTGVHPRWDPIPYVETTKPDGTKARTYDEDLQVCRIYLEYCENGDFGGYEKKTNGELQYPHEGFIWRTLECLVRGLSVLATGQENPAPSAGLGVADQTQKLPSRASIGIRDAVKTGFDRLVMELRSHIANLRFSPSTSTQTTSNLDATATPFHTGTVAPRKADWKPIAHFDIKPNNLFVGKADSDHHNPECVVHKFGDFGMARHVPVPPNLHFYAYALRCGAPGYKPPEQIYRDLSLSEVGLPGDIWCIAATFYTMIMRSLVPDKRYKVSYTNGKGQAESYDTQGANLLSLDRKVYSNTLLNMLMRCLAYNPAQRPSLYELRQIIDGAVAVLDAEDLKLTDPYFDFKASNLEHHHEPGLEALVRPPKAPPYTIQGSLRLDNAAVVQSMRDRIDIVGFGAASDTIGGNTARYSVLPAKFDLIPATVTLEEQKAARDNADVSGFNLNG